MMRLIVRLEVLKLLHVWGEAAVVGCMKDPGSNLQMMIESDDL